MRKILTILAAMLLVAPLSVWAGEDENIVADMPAFRVTPGGSAGYMYFPSSSDASSVLKVNKSGVFGDYQILVQVDDGDTEVFCEQTDSTCTRTIGPVIVKLTLSGNFAPGLSVRVANWIGDCAKTASAECSLAMVPGQNALVSVTTGCDGSDYSLTRIGTDDVLCVGVHQNQYLLAAHRHITGNRVPKDRSGSWGNNNANDGRNNMQALINNSVDSGKSSAHYCQGLSVGGQSNWYLPADNELNVVGGTPAKELIGNVFSSTAGNTNKKSFSNKGRKYTSSGHTLLGDLSGKSSDSNRTLCFLRAL